LVEALKLKKIRHYMILSRLHSAGTAIFKDLNFKTYTGEKCPLVVCKTSAPQPQPLKYLIKLQAKTLPNELIFECG